jgi:hypothetical protein
VPTISRTRGNCQVCRKPIQCRPVEIYATGFAGKRDANRPFVKWLCRAHKDELWAFLNTAEAPGPAVVQLRDAHVPVLSRAERAELAAIASWRAVDRRKRNP